MLNRSIVDLENPTVRVRLFGGRTAADIATDMPILPANAPGVAPPGPGLVAQGASMGDPPVEFKRGKAKVRPNGEWLNAVVRSLLYQPNTVLSVANDHELCHPGVIVTTVDREGDQFGPGKCRLMVVGKCLGPTEVAQGRPFVGHGSRDLWRAWDETAMPRPGTGLPTYLTNLLPFVPPLTMQSRIPAGVLSDGIHLLHQQFSVARPDVVLCLGAEATKAVLGIGATISAYRGRLGQISLDFRPTTESPSDVWTASVVATDHPAAVGRDPDKFPGFLSSLKYLSRHLGFDRRESMISLDHQMVLTDTELEQAVNQSIAASADGGYISFDCEWEGRYPTEPGAYLYTVQWSHAPGHARVLFLRRCGGEANAALNLETAVGHLRRLIAEADKRGARLVGHFAKADLPWLASIGVDASPIFVGPRDDPPGTPDPLTAAQKTHFEGAFDTYVGAHSVDETSVLKLEILVANLLGIERYDVAMTNWLKVYCKEHKIKKSQIKGFGAAPEELIFPYAAHDADTSGRLYQKLNGNIAEGKPGLLDKDRFGLSSRQIFAIRMRAWAAVAMMERYGMEIDRAEQKRLSDVLVARRHEMLTELKAAINWPDDPIDEDNNFSPAKIQHVVEFLFGDKFTKDKQPHRPQGAMSLYLKPYRATDTTGAGRLWDDAMFRYSIEKGVEPQPSTDKETLISLRQAHPLVENLLQIKELDTALKIVFRPADAKDEDDEEATDEETYSAGLPSLIHSDDRIRSMIGLIETGRYSSSRPNLMNISESSDDRIMRILKWGEHAEKGSPDADKKFTSRSIFRARAGWFLVDADLKGAEIAAAGWMSGDNLLIEHARRSTLDKKDPEWLDLHSDLAKTAFKLTCPLSEVASKYKPLRVGAKRARFGHYYGASPDTILRQCLQESPDVKLEDVQTIVAEHDKTYPLLAEFFAGSRARVRRPGWLRNGFGGTRRFRAASDRDILAGQEREAQNWECQGLVADHISFALGNLWYAIRDQWLRSRVLISVHDSVVMECPPEEVEFVHDRLIPWAMGTGVPVIPTNYDGIPTGRGPYFFGTSTNVSRSWSKPVKESEWRRSQ